MMRLFAAALVAALISTGAYAQQPQSWGPVTVYSTPSTLAGVPASLTALQAWSSGCVAMPWSRAFTAYAAIAGTGTLQAQRYADGPVNGAGGCTQPVGAALPVSALALTQGGACPGSTYCGWVSANDGMPFLSLEVTLTDTSNGANAITSMTLLIGAE